MGNMRSEMRAWVINSHTLIRAMRGLEMQRQPSNPMNSIHGKINRAKPMKHLPVRRMCKFSLCEKGNVLEHKHFDSPESLEGRHRIALLVPEYFNAETLRSSTESNIWEPSSVGKLRSNTHR